MTHMRNEWMTIPLSVALAGLFIGSGIFLGLRSLGAQLGGTDSGTSKSVVTTTTGTAATAPTAQVKVSPVTAQDHIRGNVNAKAIIVEYSDLECPFCKQFHKTVQTVTAKFSKSDVAWVYRHFPLDHLHSKARKEAEATECAAELGGNDAFWKYTDRIFEVSPTNNRLEASELPNIAEYIGLNRAAFEKCLSSGRHASKVEAQYQSGIAAGAKGTPYSVIVTPKGTTVVGGAVSADSLETMLKTAIAK